MEYIQFLFLCKQTGYNLKLYKGCNCTNHVLLKSIQVITAVSNHLSLEQSVSKLINYTNMERGIAPLFLGISSAPGNSWVLTFPALIK